jgi:hypothetical protein
VHSNPNPQLLARFKSGFYTARLADIRRSRKTLGLLGATTVVEFHFTVDGRIVSFAIPEVLQPGSVLSQQLCDLLGREPTAAEITHPENYLLGRRCWLRLGYRHGVLTVLDCRSP